MDLLIAGARIVDPNSSHHHKRVDLLIRSGRIAEIGTGIKAGGKVRLFESPRLHVSPGWFDIGASFCDPGYEYKEDLRSGAGAAAAGGFTGVAIRPDTHPPIHSKSEVEYVLKNTAGGLVDVHPIGAISMHLGGVDPTEILDMKAGGAVAFGDGDRPVDSAGLMLRSLLYVKPFNGLILSRPATTAITNDGVINEGETSVLLGMPGDPALSEELMVLRDIYLAEYTGSRLLFFKISAQRSVRLIREAQKAGLSVHAAVAAFHLLLDEKELNGYESNFKVNPPLRTSKDIRALIGGVKDSCIDIICSDHSPHDIDSKKKEFEYAEAGMSMLEATFSVAVTALEGKVPLDRIIHAMSIAPRVALGLDPPVVEKGAAANLTLFDPTRTVTYDEKNWKSRSKNFPLFGRKLKGAVLGVINNNQSFFN